LWDTSGNSINMNGTTQKQPDNYFEAGNAGQMVAGLKSAFTNIANAIKEFSTSFSLAYANVSSTGARSFSSQYAASGWTGTVTGSTLTVAANGTASLTQLWTTDTTLQTQLAGTGWQSSGRNVVTWNGSAGTAFEPASITSAQQTALTPTAFANGTGYTNIVNYIRGDQSNEVSSTATTSTHSLRNRALLLGDIVDAQLTPVAQPSMSFSEVNNPGYAAFKGTSRQTMVYAGANDGMMHAFVGNTGAEQFAYIPSAVITGPNNTPQVDGLVAFGNPNFAHHYYVDATPMTFDIDFNKTNGASGSPDWRTVLIGGLGKGGQSFYAIDVTAPGSMTTEAAVAGKVLWEFTDSSMGYSFGAPVVVKTKKYGWVVAFTSGYNNSNGLGYLYFVNPKTGALLEKVVTPSASPGMAQASAYVQDYTDFTSDSIYVGDLNGQIWRFDLTGTSGSYPQPTLIATLTDSSGVAQPITTAPLIEIHPTTRKRYVMVGTGRLLSSTDLASSQVQSFYAILDGTAGGFNTVSTPIMRSNLAPLTDLTVGVTLTSTQMGWYYDLGTSNSIGWRVVINPAAYNGIVVFAALLTNGDACNPSGTSEVFAVDFGSGKSVLKPTVVGNPPPTDFPFPSSVNDLKIVANGSQNGTAIILVDGTAGGPPVSPPANLTGTLATRILNWREIPTAN
jgi:type IV pilus assembly protein PilY1